MGALFSVGAAPLAQRGTDVHLPARLRSELFEHRQVRERPFVRLRVDRAKDSEHPSHAHTADAGIAYDVEIGDRRAVRKKGDFTPVRDDQRALSSHDVMAEGVSNAHVLHAS